MSALVALGVRLARSGGLLRPVSIALGSAVGVVLLLSAVVLPAALHPAPEDPGGERARVAAVLLFLIVPATVLLVTTGRLSSGVRDRRLAALRMIGLPPHRARAVAAVENGVLALVGAVVGAGAFALGAPAASRWAMTGPGWFAAPLDPTPQALVGVVLAVVALSVLVGIGSTWERELPGAARSESTRRAARPWRLLVLAAGLVVLAVQITLDPHQTDGGLLIALFLCGGVACAAGIALVTPLVTGWLGNVLVRFRPAASVLAGRAIQTDAAGASRVVAGLGVSVFLVLGALGVEAAFMNLPQNVYAKQMVTDGPQVVWLYAADPDTEDADDATRLTSADLASLATVPGVRGAVPLVDARVDCEEGPDGAPCGAVFVGTCEQLALRMTMSGCDDARAARIEFDTSGVPADTVDETMKPPRGTELTVVVQDDESRRATRTLPLSEQPIVQDVARTRDTWVYERYAVAFVPVSLVSDIVGDPRTVDVIADGGTDVQQRVIDWASERGHTVVPYPTSDLESLAAVRVVIWTLCGIVLGVGLLVLTLTAVDRAQERRRTVARQIMVGIPARVLRSGQLLQVVTPLVAALVLSIGSGLVLLHAYARMAEMDHAEITANTTSLMALGVVILIGGLLVALSTLPLIRTRLTPELLRRE